MIEKQSIIAFKDEASLGVDIIPNGRFVFIEGTRNMYLKQNNRIRAFGVGAVNQSILDILGDGSCKMLLPLSGNTLDVSGNYNAVGTSIAYENLSGNLGAKLTDTQSLLALNIPKPANNTFSFSWYYKHNRTAHIYAPSFGRKSGDVSFNGQNWFRISPMIFYAGVAQVSDSPANLNFTVKSGGMHHYAVASNGTTLKFYVDKALVYTHTLTAYDLACLNAYSNFLGLGQELSLSGAGNNAMCDGSIKHIRYFIKEITQSDVNLIFDEVSYPITVEDSITGLNLIKTGQKIPFTKALFYGGSSSVSISGTTTLISATQSLLQSEGSAGSANNSHAGANVGVNALFYGGYSAPTKLNRTTLLSPTATLVQPETNVGTARYSLAGANVGVNALFYGGTDGSANYNTVTILSPTATLVQPESNAGVLKYSHSGANVGVNALFYAGYLTSIVDIITPLGVLLSAEFTVGTSRWLHAGASSGNNAMFYAGSPDAAVTKVNKTSLLSPLGVMLQGDANIGTARAYIVGANVGINSLFYGGYSNSYSNTSTLISSTLSIVGAETTIGTARHSLAGSSI